MMPAALFPTTVRVGDVVNVQGPFAGKFQGQVVVRFAGAPPEAIALTGPFGGSVQVPEGATTGACTIELDGRIVYGGHCTVTAATPVAREHQPGWKGFSTGPGLGAAPEGRRRRLPMGFVRDKQRFTRGPGAIAAFDAVRRPTRAIVRSVPGLPRRVSRIMQRAGGVCPQGCFPLADGTCDCPHVTSSTLRGLGAVQVDDGGGGGGGGGGTPVPPRRPRAAQIGQITPTHVKYPGVPVPPRAAPTSPFGASVIGTPTPATSTYPPLHPPAPQRPPVVPISGGYGGAMSPPVVQIPEAIEDEPDEFPNITLPATQAAPPAKSPPTLLIAAAVGGLWLLLRR